MKPSDNHDERNDPVWELLNSASSTDASPVFVQNTVRQARQLAAEGDSSRSAWSSFLNLLRRPALALPLAAAAVVAIAVIVNTSAPQGSVDSGVAVNDPVADHDTTPGAVEAPLVASATETIAEFSFTDQVEEIDTLGDLVVVTDPGSLNEQMLADLFY